MNAKDFLLLFKKWDINMKDLYFDIREYYTWFVYKNVTKLARYLTHVWVLRILYNFLYPWECFLSNKVCGCVEMQWRTKLRDPSSHSITSICHAIWINFSNWQCPHPLVPACPFHFHYQGALFPVGLCHRLQMHKSYPTPWEQGYVHCTFPYLLSLCARRVLPALSRVALASETTRSRGHGTRQPSQKLITYIGYGCI